MMKISPAYLFFCALVTVGVGIGGLVLFGTNLLEVVDSLTGYWGSVDFLSPLGIQSWAPLAIGTLLATGFVLAGLVMAGFAFAMWNGQDSERPTPTSPSSPTARFVEGDLAAASERPTPTSPSSP